jgi:hypothetical protein
MSKVLLNSIGTPIVKLLSLEKEIEKTVWGYEGNEINNTELQYEVINFNYEYAEKDGDRCQITIQTNNRMLPDLESLQMGRLIEVQWGYITNDGSLLSPKRLTIIHNVDILWGADSIVIKLECVAYAYYLGCMKDPESYVEKWQENKTPTASFIMFQRDPVPADQTAAATWGEEGGKPSERWKVYDENNNELSLDNGAADYLRYLGTCWALPQKYLDDIRKKSEGGVLLTKKDVQQMLTALLNAPTEGLANKASKNDFTLGFEALVEGPGESTGTDLDIDVVVRNTWRPSIETYGYMAESGDLISFHFKSNNKMVNNKTDITTTVDPEDFTVNQSTESSTRIDNVDKGAITENAVDIYIKEYQKWLLNGKKGIEPILGEAYHPPIIFNNAHPTYFSGKPGVNIAIDETRFTQAVPSFLSPSVIESSPEPKEVVAQKVSNETLEKELDKYQGTLTLIGNPVIVRDRVITLTGIAETYAGKYYIINAKHDIDRGGYKTILEVIKVPSAISKSMTWDSINTKKEEVTTTEIATSVVTDTENNFTGAPEDYSEGTLIMRIGTWFRDNNFPLIPFVGSPKRAGLGGSMRTSISTAFIFGTPKSRKIKIFEK